MEIKTKADVGQTVFYLEDKRVHEGKVKHIAINVNTDGQFDSILRQSIVYSLHGTALDEVDIFLSREELATAIISGEL